MQDILRTFLHVYVLSWLTFFAVSICSGIVCANNIVRFYQVFPLFATVECFPHGTYLIIYMKWRLGTFILHFRNKVVHSKVIQYIAYKSNNNIFKIVDTNFVLKHEHCSMVSGIYGLHFLCSHFAAVFCCLFLYT